MEHSPRKSLKDVLSDVEHLRWDAVLFLPPDRSAWTADTPAFVASEEEVDDSDCHAVASQMGLEYALGISHVQDVKANVFLQKPHANPDDLVEALRFYLDNDAFIIWPLDGRAPSPTPTTPPPAPTWTKASEQPVADSFAVVDLRGAVRFLPPLAHGVRSELRQLRGSWTTRATRSSSTSRTSATPPTTRTTTPWSSGA